MNNPDSEQLVQRIRPQDVGQMACTCGCMKNNIEAKTTTTIGLILCSQRNQTVARYSVLKDSKQLFASKYLTVLPTEEELKRELERERRVIERRIEEMGGTYEVV